MKRARRKSHQHATLEELHDANAADLLTYLGRRVAIAADAADLLSETFVIAWRRIDELPTDPHEARMWLFGVARRVLGNASRSAARRHDATARLHAHLSTLPATLMDADTLDVQHAIAALPDDQGELIRLVLWDGFTVSEAAHILDISDATARGRYQRARMRLRDALITTHRAGEVDSRNGAGS